MPSSYSMTNLSMGGMWPPSLWPLVRLSSRFFELIKQRRQDAFLSKITHYSLLPKEIAENTPHGQLCSVLGEQNTALRTWTEYSVANCAEILLCKPGFNSWFSNNSFRLGPILLYVPVLDRCFLSYWQAAAPILPHSVIYICGIFECL